MGRRSQRPGRQRRAPDHRCHRQDPGHQSRGPAQVPPHLLVHRSYSCQSPTLSVVPSSMVITAGTIASARSVAPVSGPAISAALARTSASRCLGRHDTHRGDAVVGGTSGLRVDHVVAIDTTGAPTALRARAGDDRPLGQRNGPGGRPEGEGVVDANGPALGARRRAGHADVAAEIHTAADGAGPRQLVGDQIGGPTLADATEIEPDTDREGDRSQLVVQIDALTTGRRFDRGRPVGARRRPSRSKERS